MICKHCGCELDPMDSVCPKCETVVTLSGGNGFWDIAGEPRRGMISQTDNAFPSESVIVKEIKKRITIPLSISAALCLLCLMIMIVGSISTKKTVRELSSLYETQLSQQKSSYESHIEQLEAKIEALDEKLNRNVESQLSVTVIRSPTSETKPKGFTNLTGSWLFGFFIEGSATAFQWEKQQSDGTWTALEFDYRDVDSRYGLKIEQNLDDGYSKLVAVGLTQESAGNYKCTVNTSQGSKSVEVTLTLEADS